MPAKRTTSKETAVETKKEETAKVEPAIDQVQEEVTETNANLEVAKDAPVVEEKPQPKEEDKKEPVSDVAVAITENKKPKLVKVKFLKDHSFNVGTEKVNARKDDIKMVEMHIANKLLSRQIAYILG